jgi:hypothetical protein
MCFFQLAFSIFQAEERRFLQVVNLSEINFTSSRQSVNDFAVHRKRMTAEPFFVASMSKKFCLVDKKKRIPERKKKVAALLWQKK